MGYVEVTDNQWASTASAAGSTLLRWNTSPICGATCALARPNSSGSITSASVRTLHQPATAVAAAIPARAQRPVRRGGATMMLGSYVVAWAVAYTGAPTMHVVLGSVWVSARGAGQPNHCGSCFSRPCGRPRGGWRRRRSSRSTLWGSGGPIAAGTVGYFVKGVNWSA